MLPRIDEKGLALIRTGYSFKTAIGHLSDVQSRLQEIGWTAAPIADRNSTFGFNRWKKLARKAGMKPVYGVELAVTPSLGEKRPPLDYWTFLAIKETADLNEAIFLATSNPGKEPSLTYSQALSLPGLIKISGERLLTGMVPLGAENFYVGLSPATSKGLASTTAGHPCVASSANVFPREGDRELYRLALGRNAQNQSYAQHILSEEEWLKATAWTVSAERQKEALANRQAILDLCHADLNVATLLKPAHPLTLRQMCEEGARMLGVDLSDPIYSARLDRELALIEEKQFADYFYIISDMVKWAKKRMIVGPARGSSCGSLVCYLTEITAIDPIKFNLLFERFIDATRSDLPDIDLDFSDKRRQMVFDYAEEKYGKDRVARLGTVGLFKPKSALNAVGAALQIPRWRLAKVSDNILQRSSGDSRAMQALEDTLSDTEAGRDLKREHPEILLAAGLEGHPNNASQHAAGIVLTEEPVKRYVAIDARTKSAMCDKKDAEDFNLLKIDALGLTQLSIFERTLELIGVPAVSGWLEKLPLDDQKAFDVLNKGHFAGVFQFMGGALKSLTKQVEINSLEDMVAITALARPGPMASGGANVWAKRRIGKEPVTFPHALFEPFLKDTYGVVIYQEQVMTIGRHIGDLSWDDVTALRKAMSKSLGKEFFNQYGDKWKASAAKKGIPLPVLEKMWDDLCAYGSWSFNLSHAVAYGMVSYWCCWLKAHHPLEFAAATLDAESDPARQIALLKELAEEGIQYVAVDPDHSTDRWVPVKKGNERVLVGPLTNVKGLGPAAVNEIIAARKNGDALRPALLKRLKGAKTEIDTLFPVSDRIRTLHPDLSAVNIFTTPKKVVDVQCGVPGDVVILAVARKIAPRDENEAVNVAKRNGRVLTGPVASLNLFFADDTDEIFCKIDRFDFERLGRAVVERGRPGKALYAVKGSVPPDFRMIKVKAIRYLGDMDE